MMVCPSCAKFGVEHVGADAEVTGRSRVTETLQRRAVRSRERDVFSEMGGELAEDYGDRIRSARQRKGLTLDDLAKKLAEKATFLAKVEAGQQRPSDELAKRLERELGIKLRETPEPSSPAPQPGKSAAKGPVTLGDLLREKMSGAEK